MSIYRAVFVQTIPSISATYENSVCFNNGGGGGLSLAAAAAELQANFVVSISQFQSWFLGWQFLYLYNLNNPVLPPYILNLGNYAGLAHTGYIYPSIAMKLKWHGVTGGRHGRGRFYIAGSRDDWVTAGGVNGTGLTNGTIHMNNMMARYKVGGTGPLNLTIMPKGGSVVDTVAVETATFPQYLGNQRRRNYGVGI